MPMLDFARPSCRKPVHGADQKQRLRALDPPLDDHRSHRSRRHEKRGRSAIGIAAFATDSCGFWILLYALSDGETA
ncbi:MAG: hypothetical protein MZU97_01355 [Bacillus subtilis]|nr:hypothetical protein [Bacillus subtilis]